MGRVPLEELGPSRARESGTYLGKAGQVGPAVVWAQRSKGQARWQQACGCAVRAGSTPGALSPPLGPALVTSAGPRGNGGSQNLASISRLEKRDRKLDKSKLT